MMFITIACGAISGFHSLVAGGTTGKQLASETDARKVGFNAMLLESALAVCVLLALGVGLSLRRLQVHRLAARCRASSPTRSWVSRWRPDSCSTCGLGIPIALGTVFGILLVEGFVITTLDAAVRLNRYLFEELWTILFQNPPAPAAPLLVQLGAVGGADVRAGLDQRLQRAVADLRHGQPAAGGARPAGRLGLAAAAGEALLLRPGAGGVHDRHHPGVAGRSCCGIMSAPATGSWWRPTC